MHDPIPSDLTPEERRAVEIQGRVIGREVLVEREMRRDGIPVPRPFENFEWGD